MDNKIDFALMAGASYISNRHEINKFPIPQSWEKITTPDSYFSPRRAYPLAVRRMKEIN